MNSINNTKMKLDTNSPKEYDKVKVDILGILNVASNFINSEQLQSHYREIVNAELPFRELGYDSIASLVQSFPRDDVEIKCVGDAMHFKAVEKDYLKHVTSLIKRTKSVLPKVKKTPAKPVTQKKPLLPPNAKNVASPVAHQKPLLPPNMKEKIKNLMMSHTTGIKMCDFNEAYARMFGHYLNFGGCNFKNVEAMLRSMPEIVSIEKRGQEQVVIKNFADKPKKVFPGKPSSVPLSQVNQNTAPKEDMRKLPLISLPAALRQDIIEREMMNPFPKAYRPHGDLVNMMRSLPEVVCIEKRCFVWFLDSRAPQHLACLDSKEAELTYLQLLQDFIYNLLFRSPDGMLKDEIIAAYRNTFMEDLNLASLSLTGIETLLCTTMDFVKIEYLGGGKACFKLKSETDCKFDIKSILEDAALFGAFNHKEIDLPETCPILISELKRSGVFYFQLQRNLKKLDNLIDDMGCFYSSKSGDSYEVPDSHLKRGLMCVAKFKDQWYRCVVEDLFYDEVKVFYVDYGTCHWIGKHELRFLRKEYVAPQVFALRGRLAGVAPKGPEGKFTEDALDFFMNYADQKMLNSLLYTYDAEGVILLKLHNHHLPNLPSRGGQLLYFNDVMIEEGFAKSVPEAELSLKLKRKNVPNKSQRDDKKLKSSQEDLENTKMQAIVIPKTITKQIKLMDDKSVTLINLNNKAFLASCDFSSFLWDYDVACSIILDTGGRLTVDYSEHPELFLRLRNEIPRLQNAVVGCSCLTLFELEFIAEFLESTDCCEDLKLAIQNVLDLFNPQDFEWTEDQDIEGLMDNLHSFSREPRDTTTAKDRSNSSVSDSELSTNKAINNHSTEMSKDVTIEVDGGRKAHRDLLPRGGHGCLGLLALGRPPKKPEVADKSTQFPGEPKPDSSTVKSVGFVPTSTMMNIGASHNRCNVDIYSSFASHHYSGRTTTMRMPTMFQMHVRSYPGKNSTNELIPMNPGTITNNLRAYQPMPFHQSVTLPNASEDVLTGQNVESFKVYTPMYELEYQILRGSGPPFASSINAPAATAARALSLFYHPHMLYPNTSVCPTYLLPSNNTCNLSQPNVRL